MTEPQHPPDWPLLARRVQERRLNLGIPTQHAAAELSSISKNTWQRLENGQPVGRSSLTSVAEALQWPPGWPWLILRGEDPGEDPIAPRLDVGEHLQVLARLVRARRLELGIMTQRQAAEAAGVHTNTWNKIENAQPVKAASLVSIARVLRWHTSYVTALLREGESEPAPGDGLSDTASGIHAENGFRLARELCEQAVKGADAGWVLPEVGAFAADVLATLSKDLPEVSPEEQS